MKGNKSQIMLLWNKKIKQTNKLSGEQCKEPLAELMSISSDHGPCHLSSFSVERSGNWGPDGVSRSCW